MIFYMYIYRIYIFVSLHMLMFVQENKGNAKRRSEKRAYLAFLHFFDLKLENENE